MKLFLFALATTCFSMATKAQDCRGALMQGYHGDTSVSIDEAKRVICTSFAAYNSCHEKLKLRSGSLYGYTANGDIVMVENFSSTLDDATKLRLIAKLKPGIKLMLNEMRYGDDGILVPPVSLTIIKGANYLTSSR